MANIAFIWYWNRASEFRPNWRDGLRKAIELIEKDHTVDWYLDEKLPEDKYDAYLIWGDSNCPAIQTILTYKGKKGICLSTNPTNPDNLKYFDAVFCESDPVLKEAKMYGLRAIKAFGTDEEFFLPAGREKTLAYFYPATFSPWKRQSAITTCGSQLLCIGTLQPDGVHELEACKKAGVQIKEGYFPVEEIREYYNQARSVLIPAIHGSERTILEAMSMNILPWVYEHNLKSLSYIQEYNKSGIKSPREFVKKFYSAQKYADTIVKGLT